jgi:hypothetical protein
MPQSGILTVFQLIKTNHERTYDEGCGPYQYAILC